MSFAARFGTPRREEITELARKYAALVDLRARREAGGGVAPRGELLALARAFPGALRELDTLPRDVIDARQADLQAALKGAPHAPWIAWMIAYHATMRAALFVKARLSRAARPSRAGDAGAPPPDRDGVAIAPSFERDASTPSPSFSGDPADPSILSADLAGDLAREAAHRFDLPIDPSFVCAVARPPARRVNAAVFERLGTELGVDPGVMWQTLFPSRRPVRF